MPLLTQTELKALNVIADSVESGWRATTYDSTIGKIVSTEGVRGDGTYLLKPRAIVWVMSRERFTLPSTVTGITTLRTRLTRAGLLTLTVGIVDPEYDGHLSTAVINFGKRDFRLRIGDRLFRTVFFSYDPAPTKPWRVTSEDYECRVVDDTLAFSESFLTIDTLARDLTPKILSIPRIGLWVAVIGTGLAFFVFVASLAAPPLIGWTHQMYQNTARLELLEQRMAHMESGRTSLPAPTSERNPPPTTPPTQSLPTATARGAQATP